MGFRLAYLHLTLTGSKVVKVVHILIANIIEMVKDVTNCDIYFK